MRVRLRPNGKFLNLRQAEAEYGLPYGMLWSLVTDGRIPRLDPKHVGRTIYVRRADLEKFLVENVTPVRG